MNSVVSGRMRIFNSNRFPLECSKGKAFEKGRLWTRTFISFRHNSTFDFFWGVWVQLLTSKMSPRFCVGAFLYVYVDDQSSHPITTTQVLLEAFILTTICSNRRLSRFDDSPVSPGGPTLGWCVAEYEKDWYWILLEMSSSRSFVQFCTEEGEKRWLVSSSAYRTQSAHHETLFTNNDHP